MSSLIFFMNTFEFFQNFLAFVKITFSKKIQAYNHETVSLTSQEILECDMVSCRKNVFKICNVSLIFQNFDFFLNAYKSLIKFI